MGKTGENFSQFNQNGIAGIQSFQDYLMDYLRQSDVDVLDAVYTTEGFFSGVDLVAGGVDRFSLSGTFPDISGLVQGEILNLNADPGPLASVYFENTNLTDYYVGLMAALEPHDIVVNPGDGMPNFTQQEHIIGKSAAPSLVTDNGDGTITFRVDSVTQAGVDNSRRQVIVFKNSPGKGATTDGLAKETLTVGWSGGFNVVTTVGDLGQTSISETEADYTVILVGPWVTTADITTTDGVAFVGIVTGSGAGNPPNTFDVTTQEVLSAAVGLLSHITRIVDVPPERLKINVTAIAAEENTNEGQIRVTGWDGIGGQITVFDVDELGNVAIEGNLAVQGTTTQEDVVQVNSSQTITDNLIAGDNDADDHLIKGTWWHRDAAESATWLIVDGTQSGHVGIGGAAHATDFFQVTGSSRFLGNANIQGNLLRVGSGRNIGSPSEPWNGLYVNDATVRKAANPMLEFWDESQGADEKRWGFYTTGSSFFLLTLTDAGSPTDTGIELQRTGTNIDLIKIQGDAILLNPSSVVQTVVDIEPNTPGTLNCGDSSNYWLSVQSNILWARGDSSNDAYFNWRHGQAAADEKWWQWELTSSGNLTMYPVNDSGVQGTAAINFVRGTGFVCDSVDFGTHLFPLVSGTQELGGVSNEWGKIHLADDAGKGIADNLVPAVAGGVGGNDLGNADYRWRTIYGWNGIDFDADTASGIVIDMRDGGAPADEKIFSIRVNDGVFRFVGENDSSGLYTFFSADRAGAGQEAPQEIYIKSNEHFWIDVQPVGSAYIGIGDQHTEGEADTIEIHYPLVPGIGGANIGTATTPFFRAYFSSRVDSGFFNAQADPGGNPTTGINWGGTLSSGSGGNATLGPGGGNANAGYVKCYHSTGTIYIPYWTAIA